MPTRRRLLAAAGLATATAGCMSALGDDQPDAAAPAADGDGEGVRIGRMSVRNNDDGSHQVQIAVESAGGVVHMDTYGLEPGGGTVLEGDWTSTPDSYVLHARLDDGEIRSTDVEDSVDDETGCVRMVLRINGDGQLGILFGANCEN